jgi:hypothetical protein
VSSIGWNYILEYSFTRSHNVGNSFRGVQVYLKEALPRRGRDNALYHSISHGLFHSGSFLCKQFGMVWYFVFCMWIVNFLTSLLKHEMCSPYFAPRDWGRGNYWPSYIQQNSPKLLCSPEATYSGWLTPESALKTWNVSIPSLLRWSGPQILLDGWGGQDFFLDGGELCLNVIIPLQNRGFSINIELELYMHVAINVTM